MDIHITLVSRSRSPWGPQRNPHHEITQALSPIASNHASKPLNQNCMPTARHCRSTSQVIHG